MCIPCAVCDTLWGVQLPCTCCRAVYCSITASAFGWLCARSAIAGQLTDWLVHVQMQQVVMLLGSIILHGRAIHAREGYLIESWPGSLCGALYWLC